MARRRLRWSRAADRVPTSNLLVWPEIISLVHQVPHDRILDVGPGYGKASMLLREYLNVKPLRIDAIEAEKSYVEAFGLAVHYDEVLVGDVCDLDADEFDRWDLVLMVDVLEHIEDAAAFELLARIRPRVIIGTPVAWFQTDHGLPESETHRSHWTADSWEAVRSFRPTETCYQSIGAWLVMLGPLAVPLPDGTRQGDGTALEPADRAAAADTAS
jgi:SAM-dependent methyltransferase